MIRAGIALCCAAIVLGASPARLQAAPSDPPVSAFVAGDAFEGHQIVQMAVTGDVLWLHLRGGTLISVGLKDERRRVVVESGVLDMQRRGDTLVALVADGSDRRVEIIDKRRRRVVAKLPSDTPRYSTIHGANGVLVVVSEVVTPHGSFSRAAPSIQIYDERRRSWRRVAVSLSPDMTTPGNRHALRWLMGDISGSVSRDGNAYYRGVDRGEWGGDFYRIDLRDGSLHRLALGEDHDNVREIQQDPVRRDCVIVSTGIAHLFLFRGSIRRVCADEVTPLFSAPMPRETDLPGSMPIYRAVPLKTGYWFMSARGYFATDERGQTLRAVTPKYEPFAGMMIDNSHSDLVIVRPNVRSDEPYYPFVAAR